MKNIIKEPIFIVGMQRSGTTMMKSIVNTHPSISIPRETAYFALIKEYKLKFKNIDNKINYEDFWQWYIKQRRFSYLGLKEEDVRNKMDMNNISFKTIFDSVMYSFLLTQGKIRWADKTPGHELFLDQIFDFYPDAKIIYILRDPRAVYNSLRNKEWGKDQFISVFIKKWNQSVEVFKKYEKNPRFKIVIYEELVKNPEDSVKDICDFINEEYTKEMIFNRTSEFRSKENIDQLSVEYEKKIAKRKIDTTSLFKWKNKLTNFEILLIETFSNQQIFNKYYKKTSNNLSSFDFIKFFYLKTKYYSKKKLFRNFK